MPSWHQMKAGLPVLYHPVKWTVVEDQDFVSVSRWDTPEQAEEHLAVIQKNRPEVSAYILPPSPDRGIS